MKLRYWLLAGSLLLGSAQAAMYPGAGATAPQPGGGASPRVVNPAVALRAGVDKLMAFLGQSKKPSPAQLAAFLDAEIAPFFDFEYMAKSAGGHLLEQMSGAERQSMVAEIKQSFLTKMAEKLGGYEQQKVRFLPPRAGNDGRTAQVSVAILNPGRYPARLDFRLYRSADKWRVYDVSANGQSAIVHYRRQLMRQMRERRMQQMRPNMPAMQPMLPPRHFDRRGMR